MSNFSDKVKIKHRLNKLKHKAGVALDDKREGFIDPDSIQKAQQAIERQQDHYSHEVETLLIKISDLWTQLKNETDAQKSKEIITYIHNFANNISDMADTFGHSLMQYFGISLRDFCEKIDMSNQAHHIIAPAHINVMTLAFKHNIKDDSSAQAQELKTMLSRAIEKYS